MVDNVEVPVTMHIDSEGLESKTPIQREAEGGVIETVERPPSQRELAMQEISKRRAEAIERELQYGERMADDARETAGETALPHAKRANPAEYADTTEGGQPAPATPEVAAAPKPPAAPATPAAPAEPETHIVTVGNQQYKVTQAQLDQLASIGAVALEAMHRNQGQPQPQQVQQQPQQQQPVQQPQQRPQQPQQLLTADESRALAGRIQYGNEHDSAQAIADLSQIIAGRVQQQNPQVNPQALANYAVQQATQQIRQEQILNYNLSVINQEFPKIFASNRLSQLAALTLHENRRRDQMLGVQKSDLDLYREACHDVMTELSIQSDVAPQPESPARTQSAPSQAGQAQAQPPAGASRFEAKRAAPRSPIAAQRVQASEQQGRSFPTASEIVAQMKKARGQTV